MYVSVAYDIVLILFYSLVSSILTIYTLYYFTKSDKLSIGIYLILFFTYFICFFAIFLSVPRCDYFKQNQNNLTLLLLSNSTQPESCDSQIPVHMITLWLIFYLSIQVLGWILLPLCQSFVESGEFTFLGKIKSSIIENSIWYLVYFILGIIILVAFFVYLIIKRLSQPFNSIFGLGISLSNAFGLFLLTILCGYGLVELPRYLWFSSDYERMLRYYRFKSVSVYESIKAESEMLITLLSKIRYLDNTILEGSENRAYIDKIVENTQKYLDENQVTPIEVKDEITYKYLVKLHSAVLYSIRAVNRANYHWKYLQNKAFFIEDVLDSKKGNEYKIQSIFFRNNTGKLWDIIYFIDYFYTLYFKPIFKKIMSIFFILFAFVFLWCELVPIWKEIKVGNFNGKVLSIVYLLTIGFSKVNPIFIQVSSLIIICFISSYIYFSLFRFRLSKWMEFVPHHTDASSLLFLSVLIPTLCYNYIMIAGIESDNGVAFSKVMGTMKLQDLTYLGPIFYYISSFFPILIFFIAFITLFNIIERVLTCLGLSNYLNIYTNDSNSDDIVQEGRNLLSKERKRRLNEYRTKNPSNSKERLKKYLKHTISNDEYDQLTYGSL